MLALQQAAGNRAVAGLLHVQRCVTCPAEGEEVAPSAVQRAGDGALGGLGDALGTGAKALKFAGDIVVDPSSLPKHLAAGVWADLSDESKALVVDKVLRAAKWLVENGPINLQGEVSFMAKLIQHAMIGFLDQAISYDPAFKIRTADRMLKLLANPSPEFSIGYLTGFVKGLWDGVTGPFVLLWDIGKLQWKIMELEGRLVAALANTDQRKILVAETEKLIQKVQAMLGPALQEVLSGKTDPRKIMAMFDKLIEGVLGEARGVGKSISDALVRFLQQPDRALGEGVGWVSGMAVFEILLLALTEGGYTAVKEAVTGVRWVAEALEAAAKVGARAELMLAPMFAALARFKTMLMSYRGLAGVVEVFEDIFNLIIKFLKMSYGVESAGKGAVGKGERAVAAAAEGGAAGLRLERKLVNALGEPHEIKILLDGRIMRCSVVCETIAVSMRGRVSRLPPELQKEANLLAKRAEQLEKNSLDTAVAGLSDKDRMLRLEAIAQQSTEVEQKMSKLEQKAGLPNAPRPVPPFKRSAQEIEDLARDPDAAFTVTDKGRAERAIGLDLESRGLLHGPIRRDTVAGRAEFLDINNVAWDIKGFKASEFDLVTDFGKVRKELDKGENVILDLSDLAKLGPGETVTKAQRLRDEVAKHPDIAGRIIFWP